MNSIKKTKIGLLAASVLAVPLMTISSNAFATAGCSLKDGATSGTYNMSVRDGGEGSHKTITIETVCAPGDVAMGISPLTGEIKSVKQILIDGGFVAGNFADPANPWIYSANIGGEPVDLSGIFAKDTEQDSRLDGNDTKNAEQDNRLDNGDAKDIEQDSRLDGNDTKNAEQDVRLDNGDAKDIEHDGRLDEHDDRLDGHDKDIASINDGAVFYNRDADGNKTGGVTFNDGTGNPVQLGNVAAGIDGKDAVNVDQLNGALDGLGGGATVNVDGTVTGPTYNIGGATYNNVGDALAATNKLSVQYIPDEDGNPTNTVALIGDGTGQPVKITNLADGVADSDAANYGQVKDRVSYDRNEDGSRSNTITLQGGDTHAPVRIQNLADGVKASDAATVGQVDRKVQGLRDYTDARFDALSGRVSDVQQEARGGIASAMAAAGLRYDDRPGKGSIAGGFGGFKDAQAFAGGVGYTSEDGRWRLNSALGYSFQSQDLSWNVGASWTFN